jgi:hypothetical protein
MRIENPSGGRNRLECKRGERKYLTTQVSQKLILIRLGGNDAGHGPGRIRPDRGAGKARKGGSNLRHERVGSGHFVWRVRRRVRLVDGDEGDVLEDGVGVVRKEDRRSTLASVGEGLLDEPKGTGLGGSENGPRLVGRRRTGATAGTGRGGWLRRSNLATVS